MTISTADVFEIIKLVVDLTVAGGTLALAYFTYKLARATVVLAEESKDASFRQIRVQSWMTFKERFDSSEMLQARSQLAMRMSGYSSQTHHLIPDTLPNFFEDRR